MWFRVPVAKLFSIFSPITWKSILKFKLLHKKWILQNLSDIIHYDYISDCLKYFKQHNDSKMEEWFNQRFTERRTFQILIKVLVVIISISRAKFLFILEFVETAFSYWNEKIWRIWMKSWLFTWWQVVQEYERAVIFRLGRLRQGGAKVVLMIVIYNFKG